MDRRSRFRSWRSWSARPKRLTPTSDKAPAEPKELGQLVLARFDIEAWSPSQRPAPRKGRRFSLAIRRTNMATTSRDRAQDRKTVAGGQDHEVRYEAEKTGVSKGDVKAAVKT